MGWFRVPIGESGTLQKNERDRACLRKNRTEDVSLSNRETREDTVRHSCTQPHACQDCFILPIVQISSVT